MGVQDLQKYIETQVPGACVPVDLLKIARSIGYQRYSGGRGKGSYNYNKLSLVIDGECCLDRLYGGYFSDWACGGQWNRMVQFLAVLIQTIQNSDIELAVFFNGSLEQQRMNEWVKAQQNMRRNVNQVLKHINTKGTPPPKVWWVPPVSLRTCLRMALRHLNIGVVCTMDDHHQEVIAFCRENGYHGLMAEDAEYAIFDPPRYFSSEQLKLTYKGSLETKEFILDEVAKGIDLNPSRFCVFAALLGNYLLTDEDLEEFYRAQIPEYPAGKQIPSDVLIKTVVNYVRALPSVENLDNIGGQVFGSASDKRVGKFKQCVQYYLNGTKDGFLRYRPSTLVRRHDSGHYASGTVRSGDAKQDTSKFASETAESERDSLAKYKEATASANNAPQIVIDPPGQGTAKALANEIKTHLSRDFEEQNGKEEEEGAAGSASSRHAVNGGTGLLLSSSTSSSSSSAASPNRLTPDVAWSVQSQRYSHNSTLKTVPDDGPIVDQKPFRLPPVPPEVMRTASERHQKGLMSPLIYQIITQGEIKLPVVMEEESHKDLPNIHLFYRPIRQMVYAILFNLHHHIFMANKNKDTGEVEKTQVPEIKIREWVWAKNNQYRSPDIVKADPVGWAVPTVQRLWFGSALDDKKRRLRAFLTCMRSDTSLMLNPAYVPQHLLVMACVLRYIMSFPEKRLLRKQELDAFIAQAFSPELMNAHYLQELQLPLVTSRGCQLAAMLMQGVEMALFANDACGAPIPWLMCCPWLFFDGKLFHNKLQKASTAKNLLEVCDHQIDQVVKVERMRKAILEGVKPQFARPPLPQVPGVPPQFFQQGGPLVGQAPVPGPGRGRGLIGRRAMLARGGQLEIAGIVVGSWGPNYGSIPRGRGLSMSPQVTSVGGLQRNYRGVPGYSIYSRGPTFPTKNTRLGRGKKVQTTKKKNNNRNRSNKEQNSEKKEPRGRGMTVETPAGSKFDPASQIIGNGPGGDNKPENPAQGQFDDADPSQSSPKTFEITGQGDGQTKNGLKSPDSGVNVSLDHE